MAYISKVQLPGSDTQFDIADKTLGVSSDVSNDGNWSFNLVRDGSGLPDTSIKFKVVQTLPSENISLSTIYLIAKEDPETSNAYDEWVYVNNAWEKVGSVDIDLSGYQQQITSQTFSLSTNSWTASGSDYIQSVTVNGLTVNDIVMASIDSTATSAQKEAAIAVSLSATSQAANTVTFTAVGDAPTAAIPVAIVVIPAQASA